MAMITEPSEGQKNVSTDHENDQSNGDTSLTLNYSGQSEESELNVSNNSIGGKDCEEYRGHNMAPVPLAKVVDPHAFSDDEMPKTLTTLQTVKKPAASKQPDDDDEICPIEAGDDDDDEEPVLLEVINTDGDDDAMDAITAPPNDRNEVANGQSNVSTSDLNVTPNKPIPMMSDGTIEIPRELITSAEVETPIIINHLKNTPKNGDDLIAILEGDGNGSLNLTSSVEHYELSLSNANGDEQALSREQEVEIAMEQMLNLPIKKKGRPKTRDIAAKPAPKPTAKTKKTDELVSSLVSEWDDGEVKTNDSDEREIVVQINIPQDKKRKAAEPIEPTFKRSRIIKKKIIWDPDAPETAINYASLAHTSGPTTKKARKPTKKSEPASVIIVNDKDASEVIASATPKKKKTSEIDKLLGDEGAINMLNSLNQSNSSGGEGSSPGKMPRAKPSKPDIAAVSPITAKQPKAAKTKDVKETAQKPQPNASKSKVSSVPKNSAAAKKRNAKDSTESWDYIYNARPDDCMIFRRRSNSSYSSTASLRRNSLDLPSGPPYDFDGLGDNEPSSLQPQAKRARSLKDRSFEFAKPRSRKSAKGDRQTKIQSFFDAKPPTDEDVDNVFKSNDFHVNNVESVPVKLQDVADLAATLTTITVSRYEHFNEIVLLPTAGISSVLLTLQLMKDIESVLNAFEADKKCKLVLLTSENGCFCNSIDRSTLVYTAADKRRASANDLAKKISNFVQVLAAFKKPLVTFVQGDINGFGLRLLPLFDIVWTTGSTMFDSTHDDDMIEGCAILSITDKLDHKTKSKLLFLKEKLTAKVAKDCNIVTHVLKANSTEQSILIECAKLAQRSSLVIETFKTINQQTMIPKLKEALKIEQKQLLITWTKPDANSALKTQS